jgi:hypothetical protein
MSTALARSDTLMLVVANDIRPASGSSSLPSDTSMIWRRSPTRATLSISMTTPAMRSMRVHRVADPRQGQVGASEAKMTTSASRLEDWQCFLVCVGVRVAEEKELSPPLPQVVLAHPSQERQERSSPPRSGFTCGAWTTSPARKSTLALRAEKQAWEVYRPARLMVDERGASGAFVGQSAVHAKTMVKESDASRFEPDHRQAR